MYHLKFLMDFKLNLLLGGQRDIIMDENFYNKETKKIPIESNEVLVSITVPFTKEVRQT